MSTQPFLPAHSRLFLWVGKQLSLGLIRDDAGLRNYLYAHLQQATSFEIPFLNSCFHPDTNQSEMAAEYDAQLLVPALHRASAVQGRTWLRLLAGFYPEAEIERITQWFATEEVPPHFTLAFALGRRAAGYALPEIVAGKHDVAGRGGRYGL